MVSLEKTFRSSAVRRNAALARRAMSTRKEGDISNAFVSLSGAKFEPLPDRYRQLKCDLIQGRESQVIESWTRLLRQLREENKLIAQKGPAIVPQLAFGDLDKVCSDSVKDEVRKRGAVVIRDVVPEAEARAYKDEVEAYVKKNPWTKGMDGYARDDLC